MRSKLHEPAAFPMGNHLVWSTVIFLAAMLTLLILRRGVVDYLAFTGVWLAQLVVISHSGALNGPGDVGEAHQRREGQGGERALTRAGHAVRSGAEGPFGGRRVLHSQVILGHGAREMLFASCRGPSELL